MLRGTYQFFRPSQDPIAQADLLLARMGDDPDDLPPVIDVEDTDGLGPAEVAAAVEAWVEHVAAALGKAPIIYTGKYFWNGEVGGAPLGDYPLWVAQWGPACPDLPNAWTGWSFWQTSATGAIAGITGDVDTDVFNGDIGALMSFGGPIAPCGVLGADGGVVDDVDLCFRGGGPIASLRDVTDAGWDGSLVWTHTTDSAAEANYGHWTTHLEEAGRYRVEVYTDAAYAQSRQASYRIQHAGALDEVVIDQTAVDGWQSLGDFDFAAGGEQSVHVGDATGEPLADQVQLAFDAVRLTRLDGEDPPPDGDDDPETGELSSGCDAGGGGGSGFLALVGIALMTQRRKRRHR